MVQVIPVILKFHTYGTGISAGIISDLYRDHICSVITPFCNNGTPGYENWNRSCVGLGNSKLLDGKLVSIVNVHFANLP